MTDTGQTLSTIFAEIVCKALNRQAVSWHGKRVVIVDRPSDVMVIIKEAVDLTFREAKPVDEWHRCVKPAVESMVQKTMFEKEGQ